jgi:hypothetical protein
VIVMQLFSAFAKAKKTYFPKREKGVVETDLKYISQSLYIINAYKKVVIYVYHEKRGVPLNNTPLFNQIRIVRIRFL